MPPLDHVAYTATLPVREQTVVFLPGRLRAERQRLGIRAGRRSLGCFKQAILVLRWLLDGTRTTQLAVDNQVSRSTGYAYVQEGIAVLAAHAPSLHSALRAATMAGYAHVNIDGTLTETDRCRTRTAGCRAPTSHRTSAPRNLRDLTANDIDRWLAGKSKLLSTRTLRLLHSILNRSINRAMSRDKVKRNVVGLCTVPYGLDGRPSKSLPWRSLRRKPC